MVAAIKSQIKHYIKKTLSSSIVSPLTSALRGKASILCYHRVTDLRYTGKGFLPNIYLCVRNDNFEEQIRFIAERKLAAPVERIIENLSSTNFKYNVGVTFDDGYKDNLEIALPILEKYEVPATIFIAPGLIDRSAPLWWEELGFIVTHSRLLDFDWDESKYHFEISDDQGKGKSYIELNKLFKRLSSIRQAKLLNILRAQCPVAFHDHDILLSWDELEKLSQHPLITIGSHTVRHPILSNELENEALSEIYNSKEILSSRLSRPTNLFAYPIGGADEASEREFLLAEKAGLQAAFTTRTGHLFSEHQNHLHALPRITIDYFESLDDFKWLLSGFSSYIKNSGNTIITN